MLEVYVYRIRTCRQLIWNSCSDLVHVDHQYWRKGTHAGVSQSKLWGASSMSCQSRQLLWSWCSNPVHIDHQHRTESTHAGVASDHCERTIPFLVSILDKRVSPSHCWKPKKLEFGRHLKPCVGKINRGLRSKQIFKTRDYWLKRCSPFPKKTWKSTHFT